MKYSRSLRGLAYGRFRLALVLLSQIGAANADTDSGKDTLNLKLGAFLSDFDTSVALTGPNGGSREVNLEDALGLESSQTSFRGELMWRVAPRHRVILGYYNFDRSSTGTSQRDIQLDFENGDFVEIALGSTVTSTFNWRLIPVSYAYSFYQSDNLEVSAAVGVHWFRLKLGVGGELTVNGTPVTAGAEAQSTSGPLPVFGLRADYALTRRWLVGGHAQYFGLDYDVYSGDLLDFRLQTEYWFTDSIGVGLGYTWYDINFTKDEGAYAVGANYNYRGMEAYVGIRF